ncbi:MAG: beta-L-arabinofuranosidase domain-containing protein [Bacteroidales bacterium]
MKPQEKFDYLRFGEIRPTGWIREQMDRDLDGFTGHLDELAPDLILRDDIYGKNRLTKRDKNKDVGNIKEGADWEIQYLWWNSESQSNWRDGYIRQAILTGAEEHLRKVSAYLGHILSTQDSNGYLGIYDKNLRYHFNGENGELWAKATLLRGMLACYESGTGNSDVLLNSIEQAVNDVMVNYPLNGSDPFKADISFAGICHGLVFTDVLDRLHQLTGKREYLDYAVFLYRNYSSHKLMEEDICLDNILNPAYKLKGHGVHTYEHLRTLTVAYFATGDPQLKNALDIYLRRIDTVTTPSGGPVGDEWIGGRKADATETGYEYCSIHELLDSYTLLLQKSGKPAYGDKVEGLFFNAAQGARHPEESSIAYLKSDNSYAMIGPLNDTVPVKRQTRYKYSPVHQDVAVCCVPNAGRIGPYFVKSMWMRDSEGLAALLYGPCELNTKFNGRQIGITEETAYPYDFRIRFTISLEKPQRFTLKFRQPSWATGFRMDQDYRIRNGFIEIRKTWNNGDEIVLDFVPQIVAKKDRSKGTYFTFGPLVLALPIEGTPLMGREYALPGFRDVLYKPVKINPYLYSDDNQIFLSDAQKLVFRTQLINPDTKKNETVQLVPMGQTLLRQVTFKK